MWVGQQLTENLKQTIHFDHGTTQEGGSWKRFFPARVLRIYSNQVPKDAVFLAAIRPRLPDIALQILPQLLRKKVVLIPELGSSPVRDTGKRPSAWF